MAIWKKFRLDIKWASVLPQKKLMWHGEATQGRLLAGRRKLNAETEVWSAIIREDISDRPDRSVKNIILHYLIKWFLKHSYIFIPFYITTMFCKSTIETDIDMCVKSRCHIFLVITPSKICKRQQFSAYLSGHAIFTNKSIVH